MFKELLKDLQKFIEELDSETQKEQEKDLKPFHLTIKHGDEVLFDKDTDCAFVVADSGDGFYTTCYNNTNLGTTLDMLRNVEKTKNKMVDKIGNKILGE